MRRISEHVGRHMQLNRTSARDRQTDNIHIKTDRERERTQEYRSTGYRREMAFTRDKDSLMDDSARCFGRSSDTPMIFWWFDRRWHDDEFARGPSSADRTYAADLCDTETTDNSTPSQPTALMDDTVVHRWQGKHLEEHRFREFVEIDFRISRIWIFHRSGWNRILLTTLKKKKLSKEYTLISRFNISNGLEIGIDHVKLEEESNRVFRIWWWWWRRYTMMVLHFFYVVLFAATLEKSWRKLSTKLLSDSSCKTILGM